MLQGSPLAYIYICIRELFPHRRWSVTQNSRNFRIVNWNHLLSGVVVAQSSVFCVMLCRSVFVIFLLTIVLSVLPLTTSDHSFGIVKPFLNFQLSEHNEKIHFLCRKFIEVHLFILLLLIKVLYTGKQLLFDHKIYWKTFVFTVISLSFFLCFSHSN